MTARRYVPFLFCLIMLAVFSAGCSFSPAPERLAGKIYCYEKDGFGGAFSISFEEDGSFTYYEGLLSSYLGVGRWSLDGDMLTLADDDVMGYPFVNHFTVRGDDLIFLAEDSTNFLYVKVGDGERFYACADAAEAD